MKEILPAVCHLDHISSFSLLFNYLVLQLIYDTTHHIVLIATIKCLKDVQVKGIIYPITIVTFLMTFFF